MIELRVYKMICMQFVQVCSLIKLLIKLWVKFSSYNSKPDALNSLLSEPLEVKEIIQ